MLLDNLFTIQSLVFFTVISTISGLSSYFGTLFIQKLSTNSAIQIAYNSIIFFFYFSSLAMYYLDVSLQTIIILVVAASIIFSVASFLILHFSATACEQLKRQNAGNITYVAMFIMLFIIIQLSAINRYNFTSWDLNDTIRFSIILVIIRILFYLSDKFKLVIWDIVIKITSFIVIFYNFKRLYYIWTI